MKVSLHHVSSRWSWILSFWNLLIREIESLLDEFFSTTLIMFQIPDCLSKYSGSSRRLGCLTTQGFQGGCSLVTWKNLKSRSLSTWMVPSNTKRFRYRLLLDRSRRGGCVKILWDEDMNPTCEIWCKKGWNWEKHLNWETRGSSTQCEHKLRNYSRLLEYYSRVVE